MKLVSMKQPPTKKKADDPCCAVEGERPDYPWGLRITLADEQIDALDLKGLPAVGAPCAIQAIGTVMSVTAEAVDGGKENRRVELQITDLAVAAPGTSKYARMYPDMKD